MMEDYSFGQKAFILGLFVVLLGAGYYFGFDKFNQYLINKKPRTVVVLFDLSGSAKKMRSKYLASFDKIIAGLRGKDRIVVEKITANPLIEATYPVNEVIPYYGITSQRSNPLFKKENEKEIAKVKEKIRQTVRDFLENTPASKNTAILDSILLAERVFETYPDSRPVLVIFSDMVEVSDKASFLSKSAHEITPRLAEKIRESMEKENGKIDLKGAQVYVIGAGSSSSPVNSHKYAAIKRFWIHFFKSVNANLNEKDYGAALIEF